MSNVGDKFELSRDEFRNITKCLENEEFRKLFAEYCQELNDPENRKQYEEELKLLEAERGFDVKFIKPLPGYVIKTVVDGKTKAFVNVCHCELIGKPTSQCSVDEKGQKGLKWSIPYAQSQPRKDYDNKNNECIVYDVVFHYDTLHLTKSNKNFRKLVTDTALDAVEGAFKVSLGRFNLKFPKLQYKGVAKMTVIRQKSKNANIQQNDDPITKLLNASVQGQTTHDNNADKESLNKPTSKQNYTTPSYKLIHQKNVEYHELTDELDAKMDAAIPKELVLVIDLPLIKSASQCTLNVTSSEVHLISDDPAKYKLEVKLPYTVLEKDGSAKFNTDEQTLTIRLPVVKNRRTLDDVTAQHNVESIADEMEQKPVELIKPSKKPQVISCNNNKKIIFPRFSANKMDSIFAFTLNVRNVDPSSIELQKGTDTISCRFTNIGNGFFPCYYVFFARFPNANVVEVQHEEWDNNLILQVFLDHGLIDSYFAGTNETDVAQYSIMEDISDKINKFGKEIEDDSLCIAVSKNATKLERKSSHLSIEIKTKDDTDSDEGIDSAQEGELKTDQSLPEDEPLKEVTKNADTTNANAVTDDANKVDQEAAHESKKAKRNQRRKNKKRSLSESCCDHLKITAYDDTTKKEPETEAQGNAFGCKDSSETASKQRKARSFSESCPTAENHGADPDSIDNLSALIQFNRKFKGILKRPSLQRSISECSSIDEHYYMGTSVDESSVGESVDNTNGELSESCRKTVRFSDSIKTKIFRSNTSILGQKKKNAKKNESKRRSLTRRLSEGESTDNEDKDHPINNEAPATAVQKEAEHDSGISLDSDVGPPLEGEADQYQYDSTKPIEINCNISKNGNCNVKVKSQSKGCNYVKRNDSSDIEFKSDMIFDIEM